MKINLYLFLTFIFSFAFPLLTKYGKETTTDGVIIFESKDFKEGEEMHFKIIAYEISYMPINYIEYYYLNSNMDNIEFDTSNCYKIYFSSTEYYTEYNIYYTRKYFTVKKQKSQYGSSTNGDYLIMSLPIYSGYPASVYNTEEDESKLPGWAIAVIVIVIVALVAILIICCILKIRRKQKLRANSHAIAVATYETQQNYQAQAYQAQMNQAQAQAYQIQIQNTQAQIQAQAYQSQMAPTPQVYSKKNFEEPINSNNEVGYSSKAAEI